MRRLLTLIAVTAMATAMASCSGSSDHAADDPSRTTGTTAVSASETPASAVTASPSSTAPAAGSTGGGGSGTEAGGGGAEGNDPLEIRAAASSLGQLVVDAAGRTLYVYVGAGTTSCPSGCEAEWPPLVGAVTAGPGITATLGTRALGSGVGQVTIAGRPLYYYAGDTEPGASSGQGIGGTWFVVNGAGDPVTP